MNVLIAGGLRLAVIISWLVLVALLVGVSREGLKHRANWPPPGDNDDGQPWQASLVFMTDQRGLVLPHFFSPDEAASGLGTSALHRVALLTQLSVDRLDSLVSLAAAWQSRMSAAVMVRSVDELTALQRRYAAEPLLRRLASVHVLIGSADEKYPVNRLRNVALEHARHAEFVLMVDVDFICNPGMAAELNALVARLWDSGDQQPLCAVVPAFELLPGVAYPASKEALRRLYYSLAAYQVHYFKGVHAHQPTDYPRWMDAVQGAHYQIAYDYLYEPYVVLRRHQSPRYDEDFIGYGNDKASHAYELQAAGFRFVVAPDSFIIHRDHGEPAWRADQSSSESWENWWLFVRRIRYKYPDFRQIVPTWLYASCMAGDCPLFWEWDDIL